MMMMGMIMTGTFVSHQNAVFPDHLNIMPPDYDIILMAEKSEPFRASVNHNSHQLRRTGINFHIVHTTQTATVANINNLFIMHIGNSAIHIAASRLMYLRMFALIQNMQKTRK